MPPSLSHLLLLGLPVALAFTPSFTVCVDASTYVPRGCCVVNKTTDWKCTAAGVELHYDDCHGKDPNYLQLSGCVSYNYHQDHAQCAVQLGSGYMWWKWDGVCTGPVCACPPTGGYTVSFTVKPTVLVEEEAEMKHLLES